MPAMKKGFVWTIAFTAFYLALLMSYAFYSTQLKHERQGTPPEAVIRGDVAGDLRSLYNLSLEVIETSSSKIIHANTRIPANLSDAAGVYARYSSFMSNDYAQKTNQDISLVLPARPRVQADNGFFLEFNSPARNTLALGGSDAITAYNVSAHFSSNCLHSNCSNATSGSWAWESSGVWVELNLTDANGETILANASSSGYVDTAKENALTIALETGTFTLSLTNATHPSLSATATNVFADLGISTTLNQAEPVWVYAPVSLQINEQNYSSVDLAYS